MRKASLALGVLCSSLSASVVLVAACSSDPAPIVATKKDAAPAPEVDARLPYPSFRDDVVPIVRDSCALAACHSSAQSNLGIFLKEDATQIFAEFQKTSPTATGHKFVVPGDPTTSYLMVKLEGRQASVAADCVPPDAGNPPCGVAMPPDAMLSSGQLDTIRKWIMAGATND